MKYPNFFSTTISDEDLREILSAISFIEDKLSNLITLSSEELACLPRIRSNTIEFVQSNLKMAELHPEWIPADIEIDEIKKDLNLINSISQILNPLKTLEKKLEDSATLAGSESYLPSIAIYNAMQAGKIRKERPHIRLIPSLNSSSGVSYRFSK